MAAAASFQLDLAAELAAQNLRDDGKGSFVCRLPAGAPRPLVRIEVATSVGFANYQLVLPHYHLAGDIKSAPVTWALNQAAAGQPAAESAAGAPQTELVLVFKPAGAAPGAVSTVTLAQLAATFAVAGAQLRLTLR